jgi:2-polyprenyl-6-methoxyphenol hydroxylase-like FAD-dependent oxidoreductase
MDGAVMSGLQDVVVVGGGPVGLWAAAELALGGVQVTVLEQRADRSPHSKALGLHARTLEVFASRGLAGSFLAEGRPVPEWHFGMLPARVDLSPLQTLYPFMLALPQRRTEELIEQHAIGLGVTILRGHSVTGLRQDDERVTLTVEGPAGAAAIDARFVVGADGSRSTVRELAGFGFPGSDATAYGFIGEVVLDEPPAGGVLNTHGADGALIALPLGGGRFRLTGVDVHRQAPDDELTMDALRDLTRRMAGSDLGMRDPSWLTRFSDRTHVTEKYRLGRVLLAGDAAHITWPAGGVGLNVGIQDAMNLGWKLVAELRGDAQPGLLDSYHDERHPIGQELAQYTLAQGALITSTSVNGQALRGFLSEQLSTNRQLNLHLAGKLSGLDVNYGTADSVIGGRALDLLRTTHHEDLSNALAKSRSVEVRLSGPGRAEPTGGPGGSTLALPISALAAGASVASFVVRPDGHVSSAVVEDTTIPHAR